jgi:predicted PurR-regulated permease PerM
MSIIKVLIILGAVSFLWLIRGIVGLLFVSIILASAFHPMVAWLEKRKIPRGFGIVFIYIVLLGLLSAVITLVAGPISHEVAGLTNNFPEYRHVVVDAWNHLQAISGGALDSYNVQSSLSSFSLPGATSGVFAFLQAVFGGVFAFFLVLVMTFYLTVEEQALRGFIKVITPDSYQPYVMQLWTKIQNRLGNWLRGQLILSLVIFTLTYIGLSILQIKYALVLAMLAGSFELIPYVGPILSSVPAIFLAFVQAPYLALFVILLYFIVQQLENSLIVPKVMGRVTGLNPIVVLIAVLIGAKIGGIVGTLMAVPVATALSTFLYDFNNHEDSSQ